jgi:hypothetical protein
MDFLDPLIAIASPDPTSMQHVDTRHDCRTLQVRRKITLSQCSRETLKSSKEIRMLYFFPFSRGKNALTTEKKKNKPGKENFPLNQHKSFPNSGSLNI